MMTRTPHPARAGGALALALGLVLAMSVLVGAQTAAASGVSATATPRAGDDHAMLGAPRVGACTRMTYQQAGAHWIHVPTVPCRRSHTTEIVAVGVVPPGQSLDGSGRPVQQAIARTCVPAIERRVGQPASVVLRSVYSYAWFVPSPAQQRAGARWVRCDLTVLNGRHYAPLPDRRPLLRSARLGKKVLGCQRYDRRSHGVLLTSCSRPHTWEPGKVVHLRPGAWPGPDGFDRLGTRVCVSRQGYGWRYPWLGYWISGVHELLCYH